MPRFNAQEMEQIADALISAASMYDGEWGDNRSWRNPAILDDFYIDEDDGSSKLSPRVMEWLKQHQESRVL